MRFVEFCGGVYDRKTVSDDFAKGVKFGGYGRDAWVSFWFWLSTVGAAQWLCPDIWGF